MILARKITAIDSDISDKTGVKLELHGKDSDKFQLDPGNGDIYLATDKLDREEKEVYYLRLKATDSEGNIGEGQLVIHVTDRNDHQPKFIKLQVLDSRLVSVAKDKVWVGSGVGAPVLDMSETVPPGTRIARVLAGKSLRAVNLFRSIPIRFFLQRTLTTTETLSSSTVFCLRKGFFKRPGQGIRPRRDSQLTPPPGISSWAAKWRLSQHTFSTSQPRTRADSLPSLKSF